MSDKKPSKGLRFLKLLFSLAIIGAVAFAALRFLEKRNMILRENQAVEHWNNGDFDKALEIYLELQPKVTGENRQRVAKEIAACYCEQADEPSLSFKERVELYRKAYQYDAASVKNPRMIEIITR